MHTRMHMHTHTHVCMHTHLLGHDRGMRERPATRGLLCILGSSSLGGNLMGVGVGCGLVSGCVGGGGGDVEVIEVSGEV